MTDTLKDAFGEPMTGEEDRAHAKGRIERTAELASARMTAEIVLDRLANGHAGRIGHAELIIRDWLEERPDSAIRRAIDLCIELATIA